MDYEKYTKRLQDARTLIAVSEQDETTRDGAKQVVELTRTYKRELAQYLEANRDTLEDSIERIEKAAEIACEIRAKLLAFLTEADNIAYAMREYVKEHKSAT